MNEELKALYFYRTMMQGLKTEGIREITLILEDGEIKAFARLMNDKTECVEMDKER